MPAREEAVISATISRRNHSAHPLVFRMGYILLVKEISGVEAHILLLTVRQQCG